MFFRHSTRLEAQRLGIRGLARNLPDGAVQVVARGPCAAVEELRRWLHRGPPQARVDSVREIGVVGIEGGEDAGFVTE